MNQLDLGANWNQLKGGLKQRYATLTDDDLTFVEGKGDELLGRLQQRLGLSADSLQGVLKEIQTKGEGLGNRLESVKNTATAAYGDAKAKAGEILENARAGFSETSDDLRGRADQAIAQAKDGLQGLQDDTQEYVRNEPRQAIFIALIIGLIIGFLLRRR